jgi:hypothetical protein
LPMAPPLRLSWPSCFCTWPTLAMLHMHKKSTISPPVVAANSHS